MIYDIFASMLLGVSFSVIIVSVFFVDRKKIKKWSRGQSLAEQTLDIFHAKSGPYRGDGLLDPTMEAGSYIEIKKDSNDEEYVDVKIMGRRNIDALRGTVR